MRVSGLIFYIVFHLNLRLFDPLQHFIEPKNNRVQEFVNESFQKLFQSSQRHLTSTYARRI